MTTNENAQTKKYIYRSLTHVDTLQDFHISPSSSPITKFGSHSDMTILVMSP